VTAMFTIALFDEDDPAGHDPQLPLEKNAHRVGKRTRYRSSLRLLRNGRYAGGVVSIKGVG
jgi:hypothetical protein